MQVLEAEVGGFDVTFGAAAIETSALEFVSQDAAVLGLFHQRIGDLDFTALARFSVSNQVEDIGGQNVSTDDGQVGQGVFGRGFSTMLLTR